MAFTEREKAIKAMKRLYKEYKSSTEPNHIVFRNSVYFYSIFLNFLKHNAEMEIESRISALENNLSQNQVNNTFSTLKKAYGITNNEE